MAEKISQKNLRRNHGDIYNNALIHVDSEKVIQEDEFIGATYLQCLIRCASESSWGCYNHMKADIKLRIAETFKIMMASSSARVPQKEYSLRGFRTTSSPTTQRRRLIFMTFQLLNNSLPILRLKIYNIWKGSTYGFPFTFNHFPHGWSIRQWSQYNLWYIC